MIKLKIEEHEYSDLSSLFPYRSKTITEYAGFDELEIERSSSGNIHIKLSYHPNENDETKQYIIVKINDSKNPKFLIKMENSND